MIELLTDLISQLPTRRYVNTLLDDHQVIAMIKCSEIYRSSESFRSLVNHLEFYTRFEVDDHIGLPISEEEASARHAEKLMTLQRAIFVDESLRGKLEEFALANVATIAKPTVLEQTFGRLSVAELTQVFELLGFRTESIISSKNHVAGKSIGGKGLAGQKESMVCYLVTQFSARTSQAEYLRSLPVYHTESSLWSRNVELYHGRWKDGQSLALPKLNLQYLTVYDFLLRNFELFKLEDGFNIRKVFEQ